MHRKNSILSLSALALLLGVSVISCRRKDQLDTPYTKLPGKWKKVQYATDDNQNGIIDSWEIHSVESSVTNLLTFKSDSTGADSTTGSLNINFRWKVLHDDSVWIARSGHDTTVYWLAQLSGKNLALTTSTAFGLAWYGYVKQ